MNLPIKFKDRMKKLLGNEYSDFIKSYSNPSYNALRVNTLKLSPEEFEKICPFPINRVPWISNGYYYHDVQAAKTPYYHAGLFYIQEPSAMISASLLPIEPGDKVLDLCAAPGGKSTELGAKLQGKGLLVSNDISNSRAKALLKTIGLFGIKNSLILSESPEKLEEYFPDYFDKILVDAPCSGEGMFRKTPAMVRDWQEKGVHHYYEIQKKIISSAAKMLKPGGYMLYSTCTFSPEENEGVISYLLDEFLEFSLVDAIPDDETSAKLKISYDGFEFGRPDWVNGKEELKKCIRLWPHRIKGEGHFIALLRKDSGQSNNKRLNYIFKEGHNTLSEEAKEFLLKININNESILKDQERFFYHKNSVSLLPSQLSNIRGLRILSQGLLLGEMKKKRFEPSQALANALKISEFTNVIDLKSSDMNIIRYLKGETLQLEGTFSDGWYLMCTDGYPLGWCKINKNNFKNKYLPAWRWI